MVLKKGMSGSEVEKLQLSLKAAGYDCGDVDGIFGKMTEDAVIEFQEDYEELEIDGIAGPQTLGALAAALMIKEPAPAETYEPVDAELKCSDQIWHDFVEMVDVITGHPIKYGPGRGLFVDGHFVVTYGPGKLDYKKWSTMTPPTYPSFHCSSWTNFFLGWVSGRNEDYTHSGNIPSLFKMCEQSPDRQENNGMAKYRGYNDVCRRFVSDGSSKLRSNYGGDKRVIDLLELYDRRMELPTFFVCGQSTKKGNGWKWWHHTVLFVIDHREADSPIYRIAADGYKGKGGYSGTPMRYVQYSKTACVNDVGKHIYRGYAVYPPAGLVPAPIKIEE
jgi:peptidoglycan hydrolase-like protein with peptidoglycan-binding domain